MKISRKQIRKMILEEKARIIKEMWRPSPTQKDSPSFLAQELLFRADEGGNVTIEEGKEYDELYIMTGTAQGITVRVLRRGR